jgi:hypothetical protein
MSPATKSPAAARLVGRNDSTDPLTNVLEYQLRVCSKRVPVIVCGDGTEALPE